MKTLLAVIFATVALQAQDATPTEPKTVPEPLYQTITVTDAIKAEEVAPSQSSLTATSAVSVISSHYISNFISQTGDYSDVLQMSPGTFSVSPNGPGLGDTKTFFRGFKDGMYNMTFDGLPFNDTNDPTHHSWVWFPQPFIGNTVFDRSPGDAASIGPANAGGSVDLKSRDILPIQSVLGTVSYGSFGTRMLSLDFQSGYFGGVKKRSGVWLNLHNLTSNGYQTYNHQDRWAGSAKYQFRLNDRTTITAYTAIVDLASNTPNVKGPTRAQVAQYGPNFLLTNDPASPLYYGYNFYQIPTDFDYVSIGSDLGRGWTVDSRAYSNGYHNHQQYNSGTTISATSATDKLNAYRKVGDSSTISHQDHHGTFTAGFWYEWANTDRYQIPTDPRNWIDVLTPNFHEKFITQSIQPWAQYRLRLGSRWSITIGSKSSQYRQHLNQFSDNGKTIGCINGQVVAGMCVGGVNFVTHSAAYTAWQPSASLNYRIRDNWTAYAQYATGNVIPPSSVFDVKSAVVAVTPKPTQTRTAQWGSVYKSRRFTLDADYYVIQAGNAYSSAPDANGNPVYYATADTHTQGVEVEGNVVLGGGLFMYGNATRGTARYADTHLWVASSAANTETIGITYMRRAWDIGWFNKRIGPMWNDNGSINQAVAIDPFNITNLFVNYTVKNDGRWRGTKFRIGINNLLDRHSIVGVTPASTASNLPAAGDYLSIMAGRSISASVTMGLSRNHY